MLPKDPIDREFFFHGLAQRYAFFALAMLPFFVVLPHELHRYLLVGAVMFGGAAIVCLGAILFMRR